MSLLVFNFFIRWTARCRHSFCIAHATWVSYHRLPATHYDIHPETLNTGSRHRPFRINTIAASVMKSMLLLVVCDNVSALQKTSK